MQIVTTSNVDETPRRKASHITQKVAAWSHDMKGRAEQCVERYCELAQTPMSQLKQAATFCIEDHQSKEKDVDIVGELASVCAQIVRKCFYLVKVGRFDILWTSDTSARGITNWNRATGKRLATLISYIDFTADYMQYSLVCGRVGDCKRIYSKTHLLLGICRIQNLISGGIMHCW